MNKDLVFRCAQGTLLSMLWLLPVINGYDIGAFFAQGYNSFEPLPYYLKPLKDIGYWSLFVLGLCLTSRAEWFTPKAAIFLLSCLLLIGFIGTSLFQYPLLSYFGVRALLPCLLIFPLIQFSTSELLHKAARVCLLLFYIHLFLQCAQYLLIGTSFTTLLDRPAGLFSKPNSAAFYALFTLFLVNYHIESRKLKITTHLLVPLSLILSKSGTGIFCWLMFIALEGLKHLSNKHRLMLFPVAAIAGWNAMLFLTQREFYVQASLMPRFEFIKIAFNEASWWPDVFGKATHASWHFYPNLRRDLIPNGLDSTFAAILYNCHRIGFIFLVLLYCSWLFKIIKARSFYALNFTMIVTLFAFTTDVFEVYPVNVLIALIAAYVLKQLPAAAFNKEKFVEKLITNRLPRQAKNPA